MAKILDMPKLSPTMEEGQLARWAVKEGDAVNTDDLLAEVETDKATMEFRSFDKGTILKLLVEPGAVVKLGQAVAIIGAPGDDISGLLGAQPARSPATPVPPTNPSPVPSTPPTPQAQSVPAAPPAAPADGRVKASPWVRKLAREHGTNLAGIAGSGPHGRIVARDIESSPEVTYAAPMPASRAPTVPGVLMAPVAKPLSMMRKAIARRLTESKQTVPHFYLTADIDADALVAVREMLNHDLAAMNEGETKISLNDFVVRACAIALRRVPTCNAQFSPDAILLHQRVDISVAVAVDEGLMTPVVRDADRKSVLTISREVRELAAKAKAKKLTPEEMSNGTFSISNLGMFGIDQFAAVINPPEGAILAVGAVRKEPVVKGDAIVVGHRMTVTLSCDHRVVDGAIGAMFLKELRLLIEHPSRLLVE